MEVCEAFVPFPLSQQDKGPQSKAAGKKQGGLPSDLSEVREHTPHQRSTMARSFLFCSPESLLELGTCSFQELFWLC